MHLEYEFFRHKRPFTTLKMEVRQFYYVLQRLMWQTANCQMKHAHTYVQTLKKRWRLPYKMPWHCSPLTGHPTWALPRLHTRQFSVSAAVSGDQLDLLQPDNTSYKNQLTYSKTFTLFWKSNKQFVNSRKYTNLAQPLLHTHRYI